MSIVRRSDGSDIYVYCFDNTRWLNRYDCSCCPFHGARFDTTILRGQLSVFLHAVRHKLSGHRAPLLRIVSSLWSNS